MSVKPAAFSRLPSGDGVQSFNPAPLVPQGGFDSIEEYGYVHEELLVSGEAEGHPYTTAIYVRRPTDPARFTGTLVLEPLHSTSYAPVYGYCARYILRSGHAWAGVCSLKSVLDGFVKPANAERYASTDIWSEAPSLDASSTGAGDARRGDPVAARARREHMQRVNALSNPILAHVGASIAGGTDAYPGFDIRNLILAGVVTDYILGHHRYRHDDRSPVYHGFFPISEYGVRFGPSEVPIVQTISEGDISNPNRPGREGRTYRRADSDDPRDRYRLYEMAGVPHSDTRYPPGNDPAFWGDPDNRFGTSLAADARMNSLPHNSLFSVTLDHLVQWVATGKAPPRADHLETGADGLFVKDDYGNSKGGLRSVQLDVPRATYLANPGVDENGVPMAGLFGIERPLSKATLEQLYRDHFDYLERFNRRLDELIAQGWLLAEDAEELRAEAEKADVP